MQGLGFWGTIMGGSGLLLRNLSYVTIMGVCICIYT